MVKHQNTVNLSGITRVYVLVYKPKFHIITALVTFGTNKEFHTKLWVMLMLYALTTSLHVRLEYLTLSYRFLVATMLLVHS